MKGKREINNIAIKYPVNITLEHKKYFEQCLQWEYYTPVVKNHFCSFLYLGGAGTSLLLQPIKNTEPWLNFYKTFNKSFYLGLLLAAAKKNKISFVTARLYYYCTNEFSNSYYHWFTEVLPKIVYVKNSLNTNAKFFIPFPLTEYQRTSLNLLGINFYDTKSKVTFFCQLKVVENFTMSTGYYHRSLLTETAHQIKKTIGYNEKLKRKIYVTRKNASRRRILNEEQVTDVLLKLGFEIFDFDDVNFIKQVEILVSTSILVSLHGAALTNMIYMQPNSIIFELLPKEIYSDKCFFILAGTLKHRYYYLFCEINNPSHILADYYVNIQMFEKVLLATISAAE